MFWLGKHQIKLKSRLGRVVFYIWKLSVENSTNNLFCLKIAKFTQSWWGEVCCWCACPPALMSWSGNDEPVCIQVSRLLNPLPVWLISDYLLVERHFIVAVILPCAYLSISAVLMTRLETALFIVFYDDDSVLCIFIVTILIVYLTIWA